MQEFPHIYTVESTGRPQENLICTAEGLPEISVAPPAQFGGAGDRWSPEDLFVASVVNCFILSFNAIATASKFEWNSIHCEASGALDKVERKIQFTEVVTRVRLSIPESMDAAKAEKLLHKAEESCLVTNSLSCESRIETEIVVD